MIKRALLLLLLAPPLLAQTERTAALGDRVRVRAPKAGYGKLTGQVIGTTPDVLQLRLDAGQTEVAVARAQIDALYVSTSSRRNTWRGIVIGALVAGVGTYLFGPKEVKLNDPPGTPQKVPMGNVVTATVGGAAIGAIVGYYSRSDNWVAVSPAR